MVSTYPPTQCGIATFAAALAAGLHECGDDVTIVRVGADGFAPDKIVIADLNNQDSFEMTDAMNALNRADVVIVQHEYGIYDGPDGRSIVEVLEGIERPTIVVAHTVLEHPTPHQRGVLETVARAADAVVVMTEAGRVRLCSNFDVDASKISVIPHGATMSSAVRVEDTKKPPMLLTWGLLGPGKGIEWAIDALSLVDDLRPKPVYIVAGNSHPKVQEYEGAKYYGMLAQRAKDRRVDVVFDAKYRSTASLADLISESMMVILPYDSPDQVTSGVLVEAIAAGRPVIATAFPHAVELLSSGAGVVVPRRDPKALADAIRTALTTPGMVDAMASEARRLAPELAWPVIASRYAALCQELLDNRTQLMASR
jgi:polysaccharide biosynthesis protein PslF